MLFFCIILQISNFHFKFFKIEKNIKFMHFCFSLRENNKNPNLRMLILLMHLTNLNSYLTKKKKNGWQKCLFLNDKEWKDAKFFWPFLNSKSVYINPIFYVTNCINLCMQRISTIENIYLNHSFEIINTFAI